MIAWGYIELFHFQFGLKMFWFGCPFWSHKCLCSLSINIFKEECFKLRHLILSLSNGFLKFKCRFNLLPSELFHSPTKESDCINKWIILPEFRKKLILQAVLYSKEFHRVFVWWSLLGIWVTNQQLAHVNFEAFPIEIKECDSVLNRANSHSVRPLNFHNYLIGSNWLKDYF